MEQYNLFKNKKEEKNSFPNQLLTSHIHRIEIRANLKCWFRIEEDASLY